MRRLLVIAAMGSLLIGSVPQSTAAFSFPGAGVEFGEILDWYAPTDAAGADATGLGQVVRTNWTGDVHVVELLMSRRATTTDPFVVELRAGDPTGALLATSDPVEAAEVPIEPATGWVIARFSAPAAVVVDQDYAIVLPPGVDTADPDPAYAWVSDGSDLNDSGAPWLSTTSGWTLEGAGPWAVSDPVRHRAVRFAVTESVRCRIHFLAEDGPVPDFGPTIQAFVGRPLQIRLLHFIPHADAIAVFTHVDSGRTLVIPATVDITGEVILPHTFGPEDVGEWTGVGEHVNGAECPDRDATPSDLTVALLPQPSSPPQASGPPLPNTAIGAEPMREADALGWIVLAVALLSASWAGRARVRAVTAAAALAVRRRAG